ncbi:MAG: phosphatidate cytidylyltransferase [Planctomycetota bacterium]|nr:phosphatidate cytidylyltransferase [Planctomycetota bacterium]
MKRRILFGTALIAATAGLLYPDWRLEQAAVHGLSQAGDGAAIVLGLPLAVACLLLTATAFVELVRLAAGAGTELLRLSGLVGAATLATLPFWWQFTVRSLSGDVVLLTIGLTVLAVFAEQMIRSGTGDAMRRVGCTFLAVLYLGIGGAMILTIRLTWGVPVLVLFLAAVKFTDIGAYFTGSAIGRHKLIPSISPAKSWEGLIGGLVAGAAVSMLAASVLGIDSMGPLQAAAFGAAVGLIGQFADLCESVLKRSARLKDSGTVVPEFGGMLDILDSPLLAAPVAYLLLSIMA